MDGNLLCTCMGIVGLPLPQCMDFPVVHNTVYDEYF